MIFEAGFIRPFVITTLLFLVSGTEDPFYNTHD